VDLPKAPIFSAGLGEKKHRAFIAHPLGKYQLRVAYQFLHRILRFKTKRGRHGSFVLPMVLIDILSPIGRRRFSGPDFGDDLFEPFDAVALFLNENSVFDDGPVFFVIRCITV